MTNKAQKVNALIEQAGGKIFSVEFVKKDGSIRKMTCRRGVDKYSDGGVAGYSVNPENIGVFELAHGDSARKGKENYRCFNANNVLTMKVNGVEYKF